MFSSGNRSILMLLVERSATRLTRGPGPERSAHLVSPGKTGLLPPSWNVNQQKEPSSLYRTVDLGQHNTANIMALPGVKPRQTRLVSTDEVYRK